jgi:hypothetical protein
MNEGTKICTSCNSQPREPRRGVCWSCRAREDYYRREVLNYGYVLRKDRARRRSPDHQGGYQLIDWKNCIVAGQRFDLALDDVDFCCREVRWANNAMGATI